MQKFIIGSLALWVSSLGSCLHKSEGSVQAIETNGPRSPVSEGTSQISFELEESSLFLLQTRMSVDKAGGKVDQKNTAGAPEVNSPHVNGMAWMPFGNGTYCGFAVEAQRCSTVGCEQCVGKSDCWLWTAGRTDGDAEQWPQTTLGPETFQTLAGEVNSSYNRYITSTNVSCTVNTVSVSFDVRRLAAGYLRAYWDGVEIKVANGMLLEAGSSESPILAPSRSLKWAWNIDHPGDHVLTLEFIKTSAAVPAHAEISGLNFLTNATNMAHRAVNKNEIGDDPMRHEASH
eukprot:gnl/TRDRNA2_/TRDRNA2_185772_c0_seq1.p1 gnl/TRDRNA2_/TRDRNA2_185772_c0~~gnl/TRDRNA2_/TRDRNA2_185772_c0_seq1.p1  ORF type:complete len:288 (+),score=30.38 gnl/TRDRNA2_/TRDRNA2_185772_c0_seq1:108-971(+)